jgi:hypothetical protein
MFNGTQSYILMRHMSIDSARQLLLNVAVPEGLLLAVTLVLVLSRSLALRNTVLGKVYEGRSRLSKSDGKLIMDLI